MTVTVEAALEEPVTAPPENLALDNVRLSGSKVKTSFYQYEDEAGRMRAAYLATQSTGQFRSLSDFISFAVLKIVESQEGRCDAGPSVVGLDIRPGGSKVKTSFYQYRNEARRMRAAHRAMQSTGQVRSLSDFISFAVLKLVESQESHYNAGKQWPPVKARQIRRGAPLQS
ncbi:ParB family protein [Arthrobacter bambusae]|uniref:ParB family protein n=1 Tax=Arthrobacter bambusae TaxID=1338426 RepID=UPI00278926F6|nr:hypothetical protein [Arthrobacter bambusae]MDQ0030897.1 hypothetical protein [Arthrobacter bambusae]MDQ0099262.1 hypothetical protein [Arthrobacter bambusae]